MKNISIELIGELYPRKQCDYTICSKIYEDFKLFCIIDKTQKCDKILFEFKKCQIEYSQCRKTRYSTYF